MKISQAFKHRGQFSYNKISTHSHNDFYFLNKWTAPVMNVSVHRMSIGTELIDQFIVVSQVQRFILIERGISSKTMFTGIRLISNSSGDTHRDSLENILQLFLLFGN